MSRLCLRLTSFGWCPEVSLFEPFELELHGGCSYGLVGESGTGKSALIELLAGLHPDPLGGVFSGALELDGEDALGFDPQRKVASFGYVGERPELFLTGLVNSVAEELEWSLKALGWDRPRRSEAVSGALERFGLRELAQCHPQQLSGGQQQQLSLASVWVRSPLWYLLDEPTCSLDPEAETDFKETIHRLVCEGAGVLWASSRPESVDGCPKIFQLAPGSTGTRLVKDFGPRSGAQDQWRAPLREARSVEAPEPRSEALLQVEGLKARPQRGAAQTVQVDRLVLRAGEAVGLIGPNGAGKTTLAKVLRGLLPRDQGRVHCCGESLHPGQLAATAHLIAYVAQSPDALFVTETVRRELLLASELMGRSLDEAETWTARVVDRFHLGRWLLHHPRELPAAVRTLLGSALAALTGARVLIFDEPSARLDRATAKLWVQALEAQLHEGRAALLIDHRREWLGTFVSRMVSLEDGQLREVNF